jgi:hypothetical protein
MIAVSGFWLRQTGPYLGYAYNGTCPLETALIGPGNTGIANLR